MHDLILIADNNRRFGVRVVRDGDNYGLGDCLVHQGETMIEFYDLHHADRFPDGQFVSRYYWTTLRTHGANGLCLDGGNRDAWTVDVSVMEQVQRLVQQIEREAPPALDSDGLCADRSCDVCNMTGEPCHRARGLAPARKEE